MDPREDTWRQLSSRPATTLPTPANVQDKRRLPLPDQRQARVDDTPIDSQVDLAFGTLTVRLRIQPRANQAIARRAVRRTGVETRRARIRDPYRSIRRATVAARAWREVIANRSARPVSRPSPPARQSNNRVSIHTVPN